MSMRKRCLNPRLFRLCVGRSLVLIVILGCLRRFMGMLLISGNKLMASLLRNKTTNITNLICPVNMQTSHISIVSSINLIKIPNFINRITNSKITNLCDKMDRSRHIIIIISLFNKRKISK
jgi:hypothetical protein